MWLLVAFLLVPLIEIGLFIQVGGLIGLWPTLLIVVLTAVVGAYLVRQQGLREIQKIQRNLQSMNDPSGPMLQGFLILFSAMLLLTPGFFTDILGFVLLVPALRSRLILAVKSRVHMQSRKAWSPQQQYKEDVTIDIEAVEIDPRATAKPGRSGWTRPPSDH